MAWLARLDNTEWLLIFDNVDQEYNRCNSDPDIYDVQQYYSGADYEAVLIMIRLVILEQLGDSQHLGKVDRNQIEAIFQSWYKRKYGKT